MFNTLNRKIFEEKFINFLVEKRIHPSHLLKLTQELDAEKVINEAWHNRIEQPKHGNVFGALGRGLTGGLGGALKGGLRGLVQGLQTGYGSAPIETSKAQLKSDIKSAYAQFSSKIEKITGDSGLAHMIFTNLNQNIDKLIDYSCDNKDIERKDVHVIDIDNSIKSRKFDLVKKPTSPMEYINKPIDNFFAFLRNDKTENKNFDDKFVDLLVEKRVHPLYLLKLTQEISSGRLVNEGFLGDLASEFGKNFKRRLGYRTTPKRDKDKEEEEYTNSKNTPKSKPNSRLKLPRNPQMPNRPTSSTDPTDTSRPSLSSIPSRSILTRGGIFRALGSGLTGALGGSIKGGLRGLVQGLEAGYGTAPFETSLEILRNNLKSAYSEFTKNLVHIIGDRKVDLELINSIYEKLLNNSERLIDFAILQGKTTTEIPDSIERADTGSDTHFSLGNQATDKYQFYNTEISNENPNKPSTKTISGLGSSGVLSPEEEEQEALKMAARRGTTGSKTETIELPANFKKLYSHILEKIASHPEAEEIKNINNTLITLQVIKRLDGNVKNRNFLGDDNYKSLIDGIIQILKQDNCDLEDNSFVQNLIDIFDKVYDRALSSSDPKGKLKNLHSALSLSKIGVDRPWNRFSTALSKINRILSVFCDDHPDKCSTSPSNIQNRVIRFRGNQKLLDKLVENKNITFSDWLLIKENILF